MLLKTLLEDVFSITGRFFFWLTNPATLDKVSCMLCVPLYFRGNQMRMLNQPQHPSVSTFTSCESQVTFENYTRFHRCLGIIKLE